MPPPLAAALALLALCEQLLPSHLGKLLEIVLKLALLLLVQFIIVELMLLKLLLKMRLMLLLLLRRRRHHIAIILPILTIQLIFATFLTFPSLVVNVIIDVAIYRPLPSRRIKAFFTALDTNIL